VEESDDFGKALLGDMTAAIRRLKDDHPREHRSTDQYSRVNVMDVEYMPGDSDWKLVAKIFPYNVTI
jgi:hypothetical protein